MEYMKCAIFREAFEHRKKPIAINVRIIWELEIYERKHGAAMRWLHRSPLIIVIIAWNYHSLWLAIRSHQLISFAPIKSRANTELHLYSHSRCTGLINGSIENLFSALHASGRMPCDERNEADWLFGKNWIHYHVEMDMYMENRCPKNKQKQRTCACLRDWNSYVCFSLIISLEMLKMAENWILFAKIRAWVKHIT